MQTNPINNHKYQDRGNASDGKGVVKKIIKSNRTVHRMDKILQLHYDFTFYSIENLFPSFINKYYLCTNIYTYVHGNVLTFKYRYY